MIKIDDFFFLTIMLGIDKFVCETIYWDNWYSVDVNIWLFEFKDKKNKNNAKPNHAFCSLTSCH